MSETSVFTEPLPRRRRRPEVVIVPAPEPVAEELAPEPAAGAEATDEAAPAEAPTEVAPDAAVAPEDAAAPEPELPAVEAVEAVEADQPDQPDQPVEEELVERACTEYWPAEPPPAAPAAVVVTAPPARRRPRGRTLLVAGALVVGVVVGAVAVAGSIASSADDSFVAGMREAGHAVAPGAQQELLVSAARKICDRRVAHTSVTDRKATALSPEEVAAVGQAFRSDPRTFTRLALDTYCS